MSEYRKMSKLQQDNIKDIGGFVGGSLINGLRRGSNVEFRSMLTLDLDYAPIDFWEFFISLFDYKSCIYSTHKSTPDKPRLRLILPLARNVSSDEYTAVARLVAKDIGIEYFDDSTYQPQRLMYWASTSCDGEFIYEHQDGDCVDPDVMLARYKNWKNTSEYPVSSRQSAIVQREITMQADPLVKTGLVGVFCRVYSIEAAIEKFLGSIYEQSEMAGRFDYIEADSTAGVIIYGGKFAYSHHATDPANGKLLNSFDLVRIHKFGDDEKSNKEMLAFCATDSEVIKQLGVEREEQAKVDFKTINDTDWHEKLTYNKRGEVENILKNLILILENDQKLKAIVFNQLSDGMEIKGEVPWKHPSKFWRDADDAQLISYIDLNYGAFSARNYDIAVAKVADDRSYHPIKAFLGLLPKWDGVKRLDTLFVDYFNSTDEEYTRAVTRKVFIAAVARVMEPGIKFDWMLVLNGATGIGKSTIIRKLAGEWFNDSLRLSDAKDKTAAEKLQGYWILEIGELAGMSKVEENILKNFLSSQNDIYRASFGKRATPHPRQCVFIGTTNEDRGYLRDTTGNRRFWPLRVYETNKKAWNIGEDEVKQFWAEAMTYYELNEPLQLSPELEKRANDLQSDAMEVDDRQGVIESYLKILLPDDWYDYDIYKRRDYISGFYSDDSIIAKGTKQRLTVSVIEIWCEAFGKNKANLERYKSFEITKMLRRIPNWIQDSKPHWDKVYGSTRVFKCIDF